MITDKLVELQHQVKAGKDLKNNFGGYTYRSAEAILEKAKPILHDLKMSITLDDDIFAVGDRVYIKATATLHDGAETMTTHAFAREAESKKGMDQAQVTGAASSYARKYALCGLLALDDSKDDPDTKDNRNEGANEESQAPIKENKEESILDEGAVIDRILRAGRGTVTDIEVYAMLDAATADIAGGDSSSKKARAKVIAAAAQRPNAFISKYKTH